MLQNKFNDKKGLGVVRQLIIIWANVDPILYCYMALPGHSNLKCWITFRKKYIYIYMTYLSLYDTEM